MDRTNFYNGQVPSKDDLKAPQDHAENAINALALTGGMGIVKGLDISEDAGSLHISAGVGIDAFGRIMRTFETLNVDLEANKILVMCYLRKTVQSATNFDGEDVDFKQEDSYEFKWLEADSLGEGLALYPQGQRRYTQERSIEHLPVIEARDSDETATSKGRKSLLMLYEWMRGKVLTQSTSGISTTQAPS